jgi:hypothetical protein
MNSDVTLLLGRKSVPLDGALRFEHKVEVEDIEVGYEAQGVPPNTRINRISSQAYLIYIGERLYAASNRYTLRKDVGTGHMTLRLFKNQTRLAEH